MGSRETVTRRGRGGGGGVRRTQRREVWKRNFGNGEKMCTVEGGYNCENNHNEELGKTEKECLSE